MNEGNQIVGLQAVVDHLLHFLELMKARETYFKVTQWWAGVQPSYSEELQRSTNHLLYSMSQDHYLWSQMLYTVRNSLAYYHANQVIIVIIEGIIKNHYANLKPRTDDVIGNLSILLKKLHDIWSEIVKVNFYPSEGPLTLAINLLVSRDLKELSKTNLFLNYVVEVQGLFTANDVFKLLEDLSTTQPRTITDHESVALALINKEEMVPELEDFTAQYSSEMFSKFQLHSSGVSTGDRSKLLGICDFMTLLKVILQDREEIILTLGADTSKTNVFQSLSGVKQVTIAIYDFFFKEIKIDPELEMNSKHKLKMNYQIFLTIFNFLLRKKVIVWADTCQPPTEECQKATQGQNPLQAILDLNLHHHIKRVIDSDSPLSFKLMEAITEIRALYDDEMKSSEKQVAKEILKHLTYHLSRLKFYHKNFDSLKEHLVILDKQKRRIEKIFFLHTTNSFYAHYNMRNPNIDLDKYLGLLDTLGVPRLLQGFTKKNFIVLYMFEASRAGQVDFGGFVNILENLICKLLERYPDHTFESMLELLLKSNDKANLAKKATGDKRSSLILAKEKIAQLDKNPYYALKKNKPVSKLKKENEKEESVGPSA